jgi:hypothetical protein
MRSRCFVFTCIAVMLFFLLISAGCSGGKSTPLTPPSQGEMLSLENVKVGVTDLLPDGTPSGGMGALGVFDLQIDPVELTAELTSLRKTALTDVLEAVDITNFLRMAPCTDCAKIKSVSLDPDGHPVVTIGIKHPFPAGDMFKPISGRNRGDLHVFNVEGIVISNNPGIAFPSIGDEIAGFRLLNADGYTKYIDDSIDEFYPSDATIHPYILHFDDYSQGNFDASNPMGFESVTAPPPGGNLVMAMGCDYDYKDYVFNLDEPMDFTYAVGCTYAVSAANKMQRFTPEYRVPQHNKKAASEVSIEIIQNNLAAGNASSTAEIAIQVVDINHGVPVGDALDEMFADSSVGGITVDLPGVMTSLLVVDISSPTGSGHDPSDPLRFPAAITNTASGDMGTYTGLVKVIDSYNPGLNESPLLNGMDGIKRVDPIVNPLAGLFDIAEFATYQVFDIEITSEPVTVISIVPDSGNVGQLIVDAVITGTNFNPSCTVELEYAPGDTIPGDNLEWINDQTLEVDLDLTGATVGLYDLKVTNPSSLPAILTDGFEVVETECPIAPNAAYSFNTTPTTADWNWAYLKPVVDGGTFSESTIDMDVMHDSTNRIVVNGRDSLNRIGALRPNLYLDGTDVTIYITNVEVMSIDVGMDNRIVYVKFDDSVLGGGTSMDTLMPKRTAVIPGADTKFHVFDTASMSEIGTGFECGVKIQSIDIDAYGTIWAIDLNNLMHCFEVSGNTYVENTSRNFDMDDNGSNMQGYVFDFAINFYNEAFYILTNATENGYLYRVECDGTFQSPTGGNPNPVTGVWNQKCNDRADIVIDNFDSAGNIHDGEQDAQILCVANIEMSYNVWASKIGISRFDAELGNKVWYLFEGVSNVGYGACATAFNGITNEMWTKCGPPYGNQYIVQRIYMPATAGQWY